MKKTQVSKRHNKNMYEIKGCYCVLENRPTHPLQPRWLSEAQTTAAESRRRGD